MDNKILEHRAFRGGKKDGVRYKDDADIADYLEVIKTEDEERFFAYLKGLPAQLQAETVIELPAPFQADLIENMEVGALSELLKQLETDDATDFMQFILKVDPVKGEEVFDNLTERLQSILQRLMVYNEDQAGAWMQTELFSARSNETVMSSLRRLRKLKASDRLGRVQYVHVVDDNKRLLRVIPLSELIVIPTRKHYSEIIEEFATPYSVEASAPISDAVHMMEKYDLALLPVVDRRDRLVGQITHDDVMDIIQEMATEQIYGLGNVSAEEDLNESAFKTGRSRAFWLGINLINVTLVSIAIGLFEQTLDSIVALAVLMPIVANMGGTASMQTLTVMVRQMALGELTPANAMRFFKKELLIASANGVVFGIAAMVISYLRFDSIILGAVMGLAMIISFVLAGVMGAGVPILLKRLGIDPAVASSTMVLTFMDVTGFVSFLSLATLIIL